MRNPMEFVNRGYNHRVFSVGYMPSMDVSYRGFTPNDRTRWNNMFYSNHRRNSLYIPIKLAVIKHRPTEDAVFSLASTYAMMLFYIRHSQNMYENTMIESEYEPAVRNMAHFALSSACSELNRGNTEAAENCLRFSTVIDPNIVSDELYIATESHIYGRSDVPIWEPDKTINPPDGSEIIKDRRYIIHV